MSLDQVRKRWAAATPGSWELLGGGEYISPIGITVAPDDGGVGPKDAAAIAHAPTDVGMLLGAVDAVLALHKPERGTVYDPDDGETKEMDYCETCSDSQWLDEATAVPWPCATVSAITAATEGEA
ncbi:hypothetical protein AAHB34_16025 [Paenarthrobacter ureafaciens]